MKRLLFAFLVLLIGCKNRSSIADKAGWEQVTVKVTDEINQKVLNSIPSQYYKPGQEYKYFALRFLKPMSDRDKVVVLETSQGGQDWVRVFTFRRDTLRFVSEARGAVTKVDSGEDRIRLIIDESNSIVVIAG